MTSLSTLSVLALALLFALSFSTGCAGLKPKPQYTDTRANGKRTTADTRTKRSTPKSSRSSSKGSAKKPDGPARTGGGDELDRQVNLWWGTPYAWGGETLQQGADCSGYVCSVYRTVYGIDLPRTTETQWTKGREVPKAQLRRGDLVFFNTDGTGVSHVGIYLGSGLFTHASNSDGVTIDRLDSPYYSKRYIGARRMR